MRNFWFRGSHLGAIAVVAAESLVGFVCPLTTWENRLRLLAGGVVPTVDALQPNLMD